MPFSWRKPFRFRHPDCSKRSLPLRSDVFCGWPLETSVWSKIIYLALVNVVPRARTLGLNKTQKEFTLSAGTPKKSFVQ